MNESDYRLILWAEVGVAVLAIAAVALPPTVWTAQPSDVAAWVQAIGSVGAIWVGISIANGQTRQAFEREQRDRDDGARGQREAFAREQRDRDEAAKAREMAVRAQRRAAATLCLNAGNSLLDYIEVLQRVPVKNMLLFSEMALADIASAAQAMDQIPLTNLENADAVICVTAVRARMATTLAFVRGVASWDSVLEDEIPKVISALENSFQKVGGYTKQLQKIAE